LSSINTPIFCYITDRHSLDAPAGKSRERALLERIGAALAAGVNWIQIREKDLETRRLFALACESIAISQAQAPQRDVRILINDRADISWAAGAAGVHLGENSLPVRELVHARGASDRPDFLVGASCHSPQGAVDAANHGADYVFFGPIFSTPSKADFGPPQGVTKLAEVCHVVTIPVLAIGGITLENVAACFDAGAAGIAAIRLFQQMPDWGNLMARLARACRRNR
jgi:thiamine-phosphate pyrophosphorylase